MPEPWTWVLPPRKLWPADRHPDKAVRRKRYQMITQNGVVIQYPDGNLEAVSPQKAIAHLNNMAPGTRSLYEKA